MIRSMTSCEVAEEAKEKGFPMTVDAGAPVSSTSPATSSGIAAVGRKGGSGGGGGARALEASSEEAVHERERNSMGSSGGRGSSGSLVSPNSSIAAGNGVVAVLQKE